MEINIINTTTNCKKTAKKIANHLIINKLSPCVQLVPLIESIYKWQGKMENTKEILMVIKVVPEHLQECKKCILELHNYDIPEIIVLKSEILLDTYRKWFLKNSTK